MGAIAERQAMNVFTLVRTDCSVEDVTDRVAVYEDGSPKLSDLRKLVDFQWWEPVYRYGQGDTETEAIAWCDEEALLKDGFELNFVASIMMGREFAGDCIIQHRPGFMA
jgi:hypothetical protein